MAVMPSASMMEPMLTTRLLLFATLTLAACSAEDLPDFARYHTSSYAFSGEVQASGEAGKATCHFGGVATPERLVITWQSSTLGKTHTGTAEFRGDRVAFTVDQAPARDEPVVPAIGLLAGHSLGAVHTISTLWRGEGKSLIPRENLQMTVEGQQRTITGLAFSGNPQVLTCDNDGHLLRLVTTNDPARHSGRMPPLAPVLTDAHVDQLLRAAGTTPSPVERERVRASMATNAASLAKSWTSTMTLHLSDG